MVVDDIFRITKRICDDDQSIQLSDVQDWIDMGIDVINQALDVNIPHISGLPSNSTSPQFDAKYHQSLVYFAVVKYREGDSDYTAAQYFQKEFVDMLNLMMRDMYVPPSLHTGEDWLQTSATSDGQSVFDVSAMPDGSYFDAIYVYQNDADISRYCLFNLDSRQMTIDLSNVTIKNGDKISLKFINDSSNNNPPFAWWGNAGW